LIKDVKITVEKYMEDLKLVVPTMQDKVAVMKYRQGMLDAGLPMSVGFALMEIDEFEDWLAHIDIICRAPDKQSQYLAYRKSDNKLIGMLTVRHSLNDPKLYKYCGNIGCNISPDERGRGYGTMLLKSGLEVCKTLGLNEALVICADDNIASKRCIEKCGGKLKEQVQLDDGVLQCRYIILL
jgi:predicted acetyltransferase